MTVPVAPQHWCNTNDLFKLNWGIVPCLPPFRLAENGRVAKQQTHTRIYVDQSRLYVLFDCEDNDIWGTYTQRDQPIYEEEVVELFLAPGENDPTRYYEFEISPNGVLFDAEIINPQTKRAEIEVITAWDCPNIQWASTCDEGKNQWTAVLAIPWTAVAPPGHLPKVWRANFYRIERPHDAEPEFSCWSPTMTEPADFHRPSRFGKLLLPLDGAVCD